MLFFALSLLCKTSGVMFPVVLLLYAWWRSGGWSAGISARRYLFFLLSLLLGAATLWFQQRHAILGADLAIGGAASRAAAAGAALVFYAGKFLLPAVLIPNYPRWEVVPAAFAQLLPWLALAAVAVWLAAGRRRAVLFGLGCYG